MMTFLEAMRIPMFVKHVSFDLDGTLIDSEELMRFSWTKSTRHLGINCDFENYKQYIGLPFQKIMNRLGLDKMSTELSRLYFESNSANLDLIRLNGEIVNLLDFLMDNEIGFSLITSKPRKNTLEIINYFKLPFQFIVCGDDVKRGKPFSDSFELLLSKYKIKNDEVVYVGDVLSDLLFSINSKVKYIHYTGGFEKNFNDFLVADYLKIDKLSDLKLLVSRT